MTKFLVNDRCCCGLMGVTLGSRIVASLLIFFASVSLINLLFAWTPWYMMLTNGLVAGIQIIAGCAVFLAVAKREPKLMLPAVGVSLVNVLVVLTYLVLAFIAIFSKSSPLYQWIDYLYKTYPDIKTAIDKSGMSEFDVARSIAISMTATCTVLLIFCVWFFLIHFSCFRHLKAQARLEHYMHQRQQAYAPPPYA